MRLSSAPSFQGCPVNLLETLNLPVGLSGQNVIVRRYGPDDAAER